MKKHAAVLSVLMLSILFTAGCAGQGSKTSVAGKRYTYSGEPFSKLEDGYDFTITIDDDGTYTYYESLLSSYLGHGEWSVADNVVKLADDTGVEITNYFLIDGDDLVFIEEDSTNFIYVKVEDGERFYGTVIDEDNEREEER